MRRIVTAITAISLAFSLVAMATPANAAVAGYDSAYAGESAFLNLSPGQQGTFTVFFANTGSTSWVKGSTSQVDLAACLEDKVTCNAQDATEAPFNSGWLSATRYTTQTQTTVAPGQIGTFTYNVQVPAAQAAGTYRFNGALVLASTGADIRNEGYYQDVTVSGATGTASITSIDPTSGSSNGGTTVTITGSGFVCTPAFPTVAFGSANATVTSCGATTLVVTSPAGPVGSASVTVTNAGGSPSNSVTYTYADTTRPVYTSVTVTGSTSTGIATLTFDEAVCERVAGDASFTAALDPAVDFTVTVNGLDRTESAENFPGCDPATKPTNGVTTATLTFAGPVVNGDTVAVTINASGAAKLRDAAGNSPVATTRTATATADATKPSISTAAARTTTTIRLTYGERVTCNDTIDGQFSATPAGGSAVAATGLDCNNTLTGATTVTLTFPAATFESGVGGTVTYTQSATAANRVKDLAGNDATSPQTVSYTAFTADTTAPTSVDTRLTTNAGFGSQLDAGDVFKVAFSEAMTVSATSTIRVSDADGTNADIVCGTNATCTLNTASTTLGGVTYPDAGTVLTVTLTGNPTVITGTAGTVAGVQLPTTIIDSIAITDTAGNSWNTAGSPDRVIDIE